MKKTLLLSTLIPFAMICSCQKQDSTTEAQLVQRKTELDAREETLIQREKAVAERENAVAQREKTLPNRPIVQSPRKGPDAAQAEAERQRRIQQLPAELRALIPDRSRIEAERAGKYKAAQDPNAQTEPKLDEARRKEMGAISPDASLSDTQPSSPSLSPTP